MKKKGKTVCQIIRFRGKIEAFFVSIDEFDTSSINVTPLQGASLLYQVSAWPKRKEIEKQIIFVTIPLTYSPVSLVFGDYNEVISH